MANKAVMGLIEELGLGDVNENAAFQAGLQQIAPQQQFGGGLAGTLAQISQGLGQHVGNLGASVTQGILNKFDDDEQTTFMGGFQDFRDNVAAAGMGLKDATEVRKRRSLRQEIDSMTFTPTGDPIKDQQMALDQIIAAANKHGDSQTVANAMRKKVQLEAQAKEFRKMESAQRAADREEAREIETDSTGRTVLLVGDDEDGPVSKAIYDEDTNTWTVWRPDGTVEENVDPGRILFAEMAGTQRDRKFETPTGQLQDALQVNGLTASALNAKRNSLADMAEQGTIVSDMTNSLLDMYNPAVAFSDSATGAVAADRAFSVVETISSLFTRRGDKPTDVTYNGKKVSTELQYNEATKSDHYAKFLADNGLTLRDVLPEHIQADSQEAQLFIANVMQLAYLDARLQEPSNRGLSDNDVQNALKRIGAGSPDPMVFARRQKQNIRRLRNKLGQLGVEFAGTADVEKSALIDHVYQPEFRGRAEAKLNMAESRLDQFIEAQTGGTTAATEARLEGTTAELEAELAALEAAQEGQ